MASINIKKIKGEKYYYLEHSFRIDKKIEKKTKYLGKFIPKNIDVIKRNFLLEIYKEKWFKQFDKIKENSSREKKILPESAKEKERESFAIKFTYNTNKIEGSTLSLKETFDLLEKGISPEKPLSDIKETEAHRKVFYEMLNYKKDLSMHIILYWHRLLFEYTKKDIAGKIRDYQVAISRSKFIPPMAIEMHPLLSEFFRWYNKNKKELHPVELAALVHLKFVTIHPFADGNGRISRLIMNFIFHKNKFPMLIIPYEQRNSYYNSLERSQIKKDEKIFLQWFFRRYLKEYKNYLK